jgi:hypothetical protein
MYWIEILEGPNSPRNADIKTLGVCIMYSRYNVDLHHAVQYKSL